MDSPAIDYSGALGEIADQLERVATAQEAIAAAAGRLADAQEAMLATHEAMLDLASDRNKGICVRGVGSDGGLSRAATIVALQESDKLDKVRAEMVSPTEMP